MKAEVTAVKEQQEDPPRRGPGRPKGSRTKKTAAPTFEPPTPDSIAPLFDTAFGMVATRYGEHWRLSPVEAAELAKLTHQVILKYGAFFAEKYGPEIMLGGYLSVIVLGRVWVSYQLKLEEKRSREAYAETPQA